MSTASKKLSKAEQREHTRQRTLQAVLDIIVSDGMRAVRHRAVAARAGVSLGTTTYHFSSIEDLIISAFENWRNRALMAENPYYQKMVVLLEPYANAITPESERQALATHVYQLSVAYVIDQLEGAHDDRIIELAFHHESMLYPSLRELITKGSEPQQRYLERVHRTLGSTHPTEDARITLTLFRQLEHNAMMQDLPELDTQLIRNTLHRHMSLCFGVKLPL